MANNYVGDILELQDLEKINYAQGIKENPSEYSALVNQRVSQILDESYTRKRASFQKAIVDMGRYMDMEHNAANFKTRSADVKRLQDVIETNNNTLKNSSLADLDNSRRQFEINEYYYYNKLETLFFLQLFFIATLSMAVIFHLQRTGLLSSKFAGYITLILMGVVVITGLYRYFYTKRTRDTRLWHRRKFDDPEVIPDSPLVCDANGKVSVDLDKLSNGTVGCAMSAAEETAKKFEEINAKITNHALRYQMTGQVPPPDENSFNPFAKCRR